jgi:hypothetical protein
LKKDRAHGPALFCIALDQYTDFYQNGSALCGIALAQNFIALNQSTKVSSHAAFFKGTI